MSVRALLQWPTTWSRGWARTITTISGVLATGFAALVIEDVFPNDDNLPPVDLSHSTIPRVLLLLVTLLIFGWVFWSGSWRQRQGTMIYAFFLSRGHVDRHSEPVVTSRQERPVFRSLFRRSPMPAGLSSDVAEPVEEFSDRLAEMIHADDPQTRITIAPNMLLPVGLAAGWRLAPPSDTTFKEIDTGVEFDIKSLRKAWSLSQGRTTSSVGDFPAAGDPRPVTGPIWLDIYLSHKPYTRQTFIGDGFPAPQDRRIIGVPAGSDQTRFATAKCGFDPGDLDPNELAVIIARAIQQEVAKKRVVILTGRMPKSVAVAVGWLLAEFAPMENNQAVPVWPYLVPLWWSDVDSAYRYLRVEYRQPAATDIGIEIGTGTGQA